MSRPAESRRQIAYCDIVEAHNRFNRGQKRVGINVEEKHVSIRFDLGTIETPARVRRPGFGFRRGGLVERRFPNTKHGLGVLRRKAAGMWDAAWCSCELTNTFFPIPRRLRPDGQFRSLTSTGCLELPWLCRSPIASSPGAGLDTVATSTIECDELGGLHLRGPFCCADRPVVCSKCTSSRQPTNPIVTTLTSGMVCLPVSIQARPGPPAVFIASQQFWWQGPPPRPPFSRNRMRLGAASESCQEIG